MAETEPLLKTGPRTKSHRFSEPISPILSTTYPSSLATGSYTGGEKTMAAVSPAFGSAYWAGATSSHPGHDREPRKGGPGISPGDSDAREPRDTDLRQHLWSPARAAQLAVLRRSMTHCGRIPVIQPPRTAARPSRSKESLQSSAKPRQILPNPAKSAGSDAGSPAGRKRSEAGICGQERAKAGIASPTSPC